MHQRLQMRIIPICRHRLCILGACCSWVNRKATWSCITRLIKFIAVTSCFYLSARCYALPEFVDTPCNDLLYCNPMPVHKPPVSSSTLHGTAMLPNLVLGIAVCLILIVTSAGDTTASSFDTTVTPSAAKRARGSDQIVFGEEGINHLGATIGRTSRWVYTSSSTILRRRW
jgi:hypothetical protein